VTPSRSWDGWEKERKHKSARREGKPHGGKVVTVSQAVNEWIDEHHAARQLSETSIFSRWEELVGKKVAQQAEPVRIEKGRLVVRVKTSTWRHQLLFMRPQLISAINRRIGEKVVKEMVFTG